MKFKINFLLYKLLKRSYALVAISSLLLLLNANSFKALYHPSLLLAKYPHDGSPLMIKFSGAKSAMTGTFN